MGKINYRALLLSFAVVFAVAFIGSTVTTTDAWYESVKPSITPPNIVFPIVWTILFVMIAISLYLAYTNASKKQKSTIALLFGVNLGLNLLWSILFFGFHQPIFSFVEIIVLWLSIALLAKTTYKISKASSMLLWPYLAWVTFASVLNWLIAF